MYFFMAISFYKNRWGGWVGPGQDSAVLGQVDVSTSFELRAASYERNVPAFKRVFGAWEAGYVLLRSWRRRLVLLRPQEVAMDCMVWPSRISWRARSVRS